MIQHGVTDLFNFRDQYPDSPGYRKRDTSKEAAGKVADIPKIYGQILNALTEPMTFYDMRDKLGLLYSRVQPRMSDLAASGKIKDSGQRKMTPYGRKAILWVKA